jgi:hypothetical protein
MVMLLLSLQLQKIRGLKTNGHLTQIEFESEIVKEMLLFFREFEVLIIDILQNYEVIHQKILLKN